MKNSDVFHDEIRLYVHEDNDDIGSLADIINEQHINTKHLPGIKLPENIVCIYIIEYLFNDNLISFN